MFDSLPVGLMGNPNIGYNYSTLPYVWAADNGCFGAKWDADSWMAWLTKHAQAADSCLFAVVPDVVGNHADTLERWHAWHHKVRALGYRLAFVCQNGCDTDDVPWDECDAVFIGGDDRYKLGDEAHRIAIEARRLNKWVHMGRVNSLRRLRIAADMGCDSVDGTFLAFGPDANTPRLANWFRSLASAPSLFQEVVK